MMRCNARETILVIAGLTLSLTVWEIMLFAATIGAASEDRLWIGVLTGIGGHLLLRWYVLQDEVSATVSGLGKVCAKGT